jgi:hypothetical protein
MTQCVQSRRVARPVLVLFGVVLSLGPELARVAAAEDVAPAAEPAARYPYDPVCPWGRVADGRGMLVRCLEQSEAVRLAGVTFAPSNPQAALAAASPAVPLAGQPAPAVPVAPPAPKVPAPSRPGQHVAIVSVGPAHADTGELPEAQPQLKKPSDRYAQCVENNGGLEASTGQVTLRFLVRERGRAEGVAVKERRNVSLAAAKCIADVVDRRYVGYPAAPIVGATLSIDLGARGASR